MRERGIMRRHEAISLLALAATAIITLALAACGTATQDNTGEDEGNDDIVCAEVAANIHQCDVTMRDKRRVTCLVYAGDFRAGMSCDWSHAEGADNL